MGVEQKYERKRTWNQSIRSYEGANQLRSEQLSGKVYGGARVFGIVTSLAIDRVILNSAQFKETCESRYLGSWNTHS